MLAFNAVHNFCWQLPPEELERRGLPVHADWQDADDESYADWYDGAISPSLEHGREYYLAQLELMDAEIGRLLDQLDGHGLADNTIVIYLTDNGGSTCNYGDNTPLAGTKYTLWEGGIRVPFLARWPAGGWTGGDDRPGLVSSLDLFPTVLAAAGATVAGSDGIDLGPLLSGADSSGHDELHWTAAFSGRFGRAISSCSRSMAKALACRGFVTPNTQIPVMASTSSTSPRTSARRPAWRWIAQTTSPA